MYNRVREHGLVCPWRGEGVNVHRTVLLCCPAGPNFLFNGFLQCTFYRGSWACLYYYEGVLLAIQQSIVPRRQRSYRRTWTSSTGWEITYWYLPCLFDNLRQFCRAELWRRGGLEETFQFHYPSGRRSLSPKGYRNVLQEQSLQYGSDDEVMTGMVSLFLQPLRRRVLIVHRFASANDSAS